ncbi:hypothetical protein GTP41_21375 [Pseudoduganella sp. DS3]|uniref:Uncharacterized protein n=1 Tax=Pseudoduganella guangdongensis TaxID=2692179 RepID=A0A6N9HMP0_9BURK|nr:hypothetical protein [Pseudoduganella guangdongensis]MYN04649.1 hypothetical protein [Pseudoduganella guangdongensis]
MTRPYEWKPIPHQLDVTCPNCGQQAEFEFAEVVRIKLKVDIEFFQKSSVFEYQQFEDSCGHLWHAAIFFQGMHGSPHRAIHELPDGYSAQDWEHSRYLSNRKTWPVGSVHCANCHLRRRHRLNWPDDAYFSIAYRHHVLWAFHRESAVDLLAYLLNAKRGVSGYRWGTYLMHVPTVFKVKKAREAVGKKLARLLGMA